MFRGRKAFRLPRRKISHNLFIPEHAKRYARLIQATYKNTEIRKININGWSLIEKNKNNSVYKHFYYGTCLVIAGTNGMRDWIINIDRFLGGTTGINNRINDAEKIYKDEINIIAGHSLGGKVAMELAEKYNKSGILYNPAITGKIKNKSLGHRIAGDIVSIATQYDDRMTTYPNLSGGAHGISNFI